MSAIRHKCQNENTEVHIAQCTLHKINVHNDQSAQCTFQNHEITAATHRIMGKIRVLFLFFLSYFPKLKTMRLQQPHILEWLQVRKSRVLFSLFSPIFFWAYKRWTMFRTQKAWDFSTRTSCWRNRNRFFFMENANTFWFRYWCCVERWLNDGPPGISLRIKMIKT